MVFSNDVVDKLKAQAELDQPLFSGNYSNLARIAKAQLAFDRPGGSILENPLRRYIELRHAMEFLHDPVSRYRSHKWRITWYEMLSQAIPEDEIELFCALLFASSLLSVVRHWYSFDAVGRASLPYGDQLIEEIQENPLFQGDYSQAQDCAVKFSSKLEESIQPVWGILSSARFVISPHSLPTWVLDFHRTGKRDPPDYYFWSDKYSEVFQQGMTILLSRCQEEIELMDLSAQTRGAKLLELYKLEAFRRYSVYV